VLQRLRTGGLAALLAGRRLLRLGEAVTILAPVVSAVAAMHSRGVSHGSIGAGSVLVDGSGAPVITGFGAATCFGASGSEQSEAALESEPQVLVDRAALVKLIASVVGKTVATDSSAAGFTRWLAAQVGGVIDLAELERRIF